MEEFPFVLLAFMMGGNKIRMVEAVQLCAKQHESHQTKWVDHCRGCGVRSIVAYPVLQGYFSWMR